MRRGSQQKWHRRFRAPSHFQFHSFEQAYPFTVPIAVVLQHGISFEEPLEFHGEDGLKDRQETGTGSILFLTGTILWWLAEKYAVSPLAGTTSFH